MMPPPNDDDAPIREKRREMWQSLEDGFRERTGGLPVLASSHPEDLSRRDLLRLLGASAGLAGVGACVRAPEKEILPYSKQPPEVTPGVAKFYATTMVLDGYGKGLLVESHEGRPTKVEGNPDHPASLGAAGIFEQALVLGLYDPSRPRMGVMRRGAPERWVTFQEAHKNSGVASSGRGVHFVLEPTSSPLRVALIQRIRARLPESEFHYVAPLGRGDVWEGARVALGQSLETQVNLTGAKTILSIDSDFTASGPNSHRLARQFADGRRLTRASDEMSRLYLVEAELSVTGSIADHHIAVRDCDLPALTAALAARILRTDPSVSVALINRLTGIGARSQVDPSRLDAVADDLISHRGSSVVLVGDAQPPAVHALGHAMNAALGNVGRTISYTKSPIFEVSQPSHDPGALIRELDAGHVDTLLFLGGNPAYDTFADLGLGASIGKARESIHLGAYVNETAHLVDWFIPQAHIFESWGDTRAVDGTISLLQPLIAPMFDARTVDEVLAIFAGLGTTALDAYSLVRSYWLETHGQADFAAFWEATLRSGVMSGTAFAPEQAKIAWRSLESALDSLEGSSPTGALEIRFRSDGRVHDGRFTNNAWLLELPDPITQLTWDNAALLAEETMVRLGLRDEDVIELRYQGRALQVVALTARHHAPESVTLHLGYGRAGEEALAQGIGVNAYLLRTSTAPYAGLGVEIRKTGENYPLARAQLEFDLHGRDDEVLLHRSLEEYRHEPALARDKNTHPPMLYELKPTAPQQWAMTIDLSVCTGCSACVVACQAENNVPVVGKQGIRKGRRMHWLRVDRYAIGESKNSRLLPQPMLCQHCEKAPCEYVCPVNATSHSADGLNQMTYNRCVGTRFCSNNCPYKVRRFNWFNYHDGITPVERLVMNPDVTVRARGVMEKCSFCVQRIRKAEIHAKVAGRSIRDGEVRTACQQTCPTNAIVFGNLSDPASEVARGHQNERAFAALHDLGTVPRVRYLASIRNQNPKLP